METPQSLINAAQAAAKNGHIHYIGVWEEMAKRIKAPQGVFANSAPMIRPLMKASPGVCIVAVDETVNDNTRMVIRPFIWTEDLSEQAAALASAIYDLGIKDGFIEAASALTEV